MVGGSAAAHGTAAAKPGQAARMIVVRAIRLASAALTGSPFVGAAALAGASIEAARADMLKS